MPLAREAPRSRVSSNTCRQPGWSYLRDVEIEIGASQRRSETDSLPRPGTGFLNTLHVHPDSSPSKADLHNSIFEDLGQDIVHSNNVPRD
jgi:hypothetical protein